MKDIVILIPNQKCLLKIKALAPVEIHQSLTNLKILKDEKEERERIKKESKSGTCGKNFHTFLKNR